MAHRSIGGHPGPCYNHPGALAERATTLNPGCAYAWFVLALVTLVPVHEAFGGAPTVLGGTSPLVISGSTVNPPKPS